MGGVKVLVQEFFFGGGGGDFVRSPTDFGGVLIFLSIQSSPTLGIQSTPWEYKILVSIKKLYLTIIIRQRLSKYWHIFTLLKANNCFSIIFRCEQQKV